MKISPTAIRFELSSELYFPDSFKIYGKHLGLCIEEVMSVLFPPHSPIPQAFTLTVIPRIFSGKYKLNYLGDVINRITGEAHMLGLYEKIFLEKIILRNFDTQVSSIVHINNEKSIQT